jgi:hypothetical protein
VPASPVIAWRGADACRTNLELAMTVAEKLGSENTGMLAQVFRTAAAAINLMEKAGQRPDLFPAFGPGESAVTFRRAVARELRNGRVLTGRRRLLAAAVDEYPANVLVSRGLAGLPSGDAQV